MIRFTDVSKTYKTAEGPVHALDGLSVEIEPGAFVAVRGPSGCGKSTLLSLCGGLTRPTSGQVEVAGVDLTKMSYAGRAQFRAEKIGFVFQMFHLLPYLSVIDNVVLAAAPQAADGVRGRADELLRAFNLSDRLTHRPAELSTGERQRVAIARALVNRPELILADEPTGNLDPDNAAAVLDLLSDFHAKGGTLLLATHSSEVAARAQRALHLDRGRLQAAASTTSG